MYFSRHATRRLMKFSASFLGILAALGPAAAADHWVDAALKSLPQHFESVIHPGCLLPEPSVLSRAPLPRATLYVSVNTEGKIETRKVLHSTGDPEVDAALVDAVAACTFDPKYTVTPPSTERKTQTEFREVTVQWPVPVPTWGAHLCFSPEYTHAVRRTEAQGIVRVLATRAEGGGPPALEVVEPSSPRAELRQLTLDAVAACFAHPRIHANMPTQQGFQYRYQWVLR